MFKQPALAPSPQPRPAPTTRALPAEHADQRGPFWMPIGGPSQTPIDRRALLFDVGGSITTIDDLTRSSGGRRRPNSPSLAIRDGIWRCAMPRAPRQLPSLPPPNRANPAAGANSGLDKTWGQGHEGLPVDYVGIEPLWAPAAHMFVLRMSR